MYALDFEYDGLRLSDFGFIICDFNASSGANIVSAGSKITFNTVSRNKGKNYSLSGTQYDECIQTTFDICKNPDLYDDLKITRDEYKDLKRWLNRHEFLKFQLLNEEDIEYEFRFYEASFNIDKVNINETLYGIELTMETNKPFGYGMEKTISWDMEDTSKVYTLIDTSDEIGYIYPSMVITCKSSGDLSIHNENEDCTMTIENCSAGEVITIDGDILDVKSSLNSHHVYDDFNFEFFRIGNTLRNRENKISTTLPCTLEIKYNPIIKDTPD